MVLKVKFHFFLPDELIFDFFMKAIISFRLNNNLYKYLENLRLF